jgi:hypothetical protein
MTAPANATPAPPVVSSTLFGFHAYEGAQPGLPGAGTYRTFAPSWCEIEPTRGHYNWTTLDMVVRRATTEWGYKDVLFTFVGSPAWATRGSHAWSGGQGGAAWNMCHDGNSSDDALPPDAAHMADFAVFARAVATRYDGKHGVGLISSFQVWNEITSQQFFQGSPTEVATMTQRAYAAIKAGNRNALVVSASVQTHRAWHWPIASAYFAALRLRNWPVDVFSAHFYSASDAAMRSQMIQFQTTLRQAGAPGKPRWNTEVNIADSASSGGAAATVSRMYLNSLRYGISRSYWYLWGSTKGPGSIYMNNSSTGRAARDALNATSAWIVGSRFDVCSKKSSGLVVCTFTRVSTAKSFTVVWNEDSTASVLYPVSHKTITPLIGKTSLNFTGNVKVGAAPMRIS